MAHELLYGRNVVRESLLAARRTFFGLWHLAEAGADPHGREIIHLARALHIPLKELDRHRLSQLADDRHHQGVVLEASAYPYVEPEEIVDAAGRADAPPFLLLLDCLQDPQNLGTLLRTGEAVGLHGVIIPERRAAAVTPAVVSASAGASEWLRVAQVTNLARAMELLTKRGVWLVGLEDRPEAQPFDQVTWPAALGLVVGSEGEGLRRLTREKCDLLVRLPMVGRINSLNAAVAGSIALYAAHTARRLSPPSHPSGK
jgi:23S rRNA (guanosine2251-2'-O)-methyltransferase